jgi:hypothetical protein
MRQYQYLLIQKAVAACGYSVANGITHSTLKNRINMMLTNKKTNRASWLKLLAMLPIVGTALALNAETVNDYVYEDTQEQPQKKIVKKGHKAAQVKLNDKTIEVKAAAETHEMVMERMTAMVRFKTRDAKPAEAKRVKFYYEGGSGAINVLTGYGVDKSKQTVFVDMPDSLTGKPLQFSLYTFPRTDSDVLRLAVSMFTADETLIKYPGTDEGTRTFTNIPIKRNQITECSGYFFTEGSQGNGESGDDNGDQHGTGNGDEPAANTATSFLVVVNPEWGDVVEYAY